MMEYNSTPLFGISYELKLDLIETEANDWRVLWTSIGFKTSIFESIQATQKINHFPGSTALTHKDLLAYNVRKKKERFGAEYDIIPETFVLPNEYSAAYNRIIEVGGIWISKPYALSQGRGIYLVL